MCYRLLGRATVAISGSRYVLEKHTFEYSLAGFIAPFISLQHMLLSTPKWIGLLAVAFVAGSFVASPELRAYAANTIGSSDIIDESIQSVDIKNGQVKASDIATDAVTAAEIKGVTKLDFAKCLLTSTEADVVMPPGAGLKVNCNISGLSGNDQVIATFAGVGTCLPVSGITMHSGSVDVFIRNVCPVNVNPGANSFISLMVYHK